MKASEVAGVLLLAATVMNGCSSRANERDRNDNSFTVQDSADWSDAAGRVVNLLLAPSQPRGGIWPAPDNQ
ncbi:MAG TPA: hypothetical protein VHX44_18775 [Planctomycetota bacterium]|nr:hypothetical protein [Planctomycetota bacterium]